MESTIVQYSGFSMYYASLCQMLSELVKILLQILEANVLAKRKKYNYG